MEKDWIYNILETHAGSFYEKGYTNQDYLDVIISLVFWKYISQEAANNNSLWQFLPNRLYMDQVTIFNDPDSKKVKNQIKEVLEKLSDHPGFTTLFAGNPSISNIDYYLLSGLARSFFEYFSGNWEWSEKNVTQFFQSIESFFAERMDTPHRFFTPQQICKLLSGLLKPSEQSTAYDPFCRDNLLLLSCFTGTNRLAKITAAADNNFNARMARLKSLILGFSRCDIDVRTIQQSSTEIKKFDFVLTNPPFGEKSYDRFKVNSGRWSYRFAGISSEIDFLCHALDHLKPKGRAAVIVPVGMLSGPGKKAGLRQALVESGMLTAILYLPRWTFYKTGVMTAILLFDTGRENKTILMMDATALGMRQRNQHILSSEDLNLLTTLYQNFILEQENIIGTNTDIRVVVTKEEVKSRRFDMQFQTYLPSRIDHKSRRKKSDKLWEEYLELQRELSECQKKLVKLFSNNNTKTESK